MKMNDFMQQLVGVLHDTVTNPMDYFYGAGMQHSSLAAQAYAQQAALQAQAQMQFCGYGSPTALVNVLADWNCDYCGSKHPHTLYKCENCGAPKR